MAPGRHHHGIAGLALLKAALAALRKEYEWHDIVSVDKGSPSDVAEHQAIVRRDHHRLLVARSVPVRTASA